LLLIREGERAQHVRTVNKAAGITRYRRCKGGSLQTRARHDRHQQTQTRRASFPLIYNIHTLPIVQLALDTYTALGNGTFGNQHYYPLHTTLVPSPTRCRCLRLIVCLVLQQSIYGRNIETLPDTQKAQKPPMSLQATPRKYGRVQPCQPSCSSRVVAEMQYMQGWCRRICG
jgi:hypothetical protein